MLKDFLKLIFKIALILGVYYVLSIFIDDLYIVIGVSVITIPAIIYNVIGNSKYVYELEDLCNSSNFLEKVKKVYIRKEESIYNCYLAYAHIYQGDFDEAALAISKIIKDKITKNNKALQIYYIVLLKLAFEEENLEKFNTVYREFQMIELHKKEKISHQVFEIPKYILEERYEETVELLSELIPQQAKKYVIIELEYYLAIAYLKLKNYKDAKAVLEFVSNKKYQVFYVERCKELLKTIPEGN